MAAGKAARVEVPRSSHAGWDAPSNRMGPVERLEAEAETRVPELVPVRHARMATSAFAFFRGSAGLMAADLSSTPATGMRVQLCGDAHVTNFGGFASPERNLLFDLNDFDETLPGPWEWDLKRLAASAVIAARERGMGPKDSVAIARGAARAYRRAMRDFAQMRALDVWYARLDESTLATLLYSQAGTRVARRFDRAAAKARSKESTRAFAKLAYETNGSARIAADPPLIVPVEDLVPAAEAAQIDGFMSGLLAQYRNTLPSERRRLFDRYGYVHAARKVVGVGSVGTRAWVLLLLSGDNGDPLFLQAKEAGASVLEPYCERCRYDNQGRRVVEGQRLMQAASDIFLGWLRTEGLDGRTRDFYVRQLWDWKASADLEQIEPKGLKIYVKLCAWTLARAHARTGDAAAIGAYMGSGEAFDRAVAAFAEAYADQNERDYGEFVEAIADGRIPADAAVPTAA